MQLSVPEMFYQFPYIQTQKSTTNYAMCATWHCHLLLWPLWHTQIFFISISKALTTVATATAIWYTLIYHSQQNSHADLQVCLQHPISHMYTRLTSFHFYIFSYNFLRSTLFRACNFLSLHHSFLCLGSTCHPPVNAKPTHFNPLPTALYINCFKGS